MGTAAAGHRRGLPTGVDGATEGGATSVEGGCALAGMGEGRIRNSGEAVMDAMDALDVESAEAPRGAACCYCRAAEVAPEDARLARIGIGHLGFRTRALEAGRRWRRDWETAVEVLAAERGRLAWHRSSGLPVAGVVILSVGGSKQLSQCELVCFLYRTCSGSACLVRIHDRLAQISHDAAPPRSLILVHSGPDRTHAGSASGL